MSISIILIEVLFISLSVAFLSKYDSLRATWGFLLGLWVSNLADSLIKYCK